MKPTLAMFLLMAGCWKQKPPAIVQPDPILTAISKIEKFVEISGKTQELLSEEAQLFSDCKRQTAAKFKSLHCEDRRLDLIARVDKLEKEMEANK